MEGVPEEVVTEAEFARRLGVSPQYVNRLKAEGRLALDAGGRVRVEASRRLIAQTSEGKRPGLADRIEADGTAMDEMALASGGEGMPRDRIRKLLVLLAGDMDEFEIALRRGEYARVDEVEAAALGFGVDVRAALDNALATLPARLAVCASQAELEAVLREAIGQLRERLPRLMAQRLAAAGVMRDAAG